MIDKKFNNLVFIKKTDFFSDKKIISKNIDCFHLEILDESPNHGGYSGQVSHIKVIIVSDLFVDKSLINRHKEVYRAMESYVSEIHAISIVAKSIAQWKESEDFIEYSLPLKCFSNNSSLDLSKVNLPMYLATKGPLDLDLMNVEIGRDKGDKVLKCY